MKIFKRKKANNQDFVNIKYSKLDHIGKVQKVPIIQKETIDNLQTQIEQLKTRNQQLQNNVDLLQNSVNSLQNNLSNVNNKISNLPGPVKYRKFVFDKGPYKFNQVDIGNNTVLVKIENLNFTSVGDFKGLKPWTDYFVDIYLDKFQINSNQSYKNMDRFIERRLVRTDNKGVFKLHVSNYNSELCFFFSTEKYFDLMSSFNVVEVQIEYLVYEEVTI